MKRIIFLALALIYSLASFSQDNEATQIAFKDIIANNPLTSGRVAAALTSIIKGKPNYIGAYTATGTNTYAASVVSSFSAYTKNDVFIINFTNPNSSSCTLNFNSVGAKALIMNDGSALSGSEISANSYYIVAYDGTSLRIVGGVGSGGGGGSSTFTGLTDGPGAFTGKTLNYTRVNAGETALEYRTPSQVRADIGAGTGDGTLTGVTGTTNRITSSGGTAPAIDISASYIGQSSITTLGTIGTGVWNGTAIGDTYISSASTWNAKESVLTFSSPLSRSTNTISIPVATGSVNGYLSSTDWTTFNGKQAALTLGTGVSTWLTTPSWTNFNSAITGTAPYWATSGSTTITTPTITGTPTWTQSSSSSTNTFQTFTQAAHTGGAPTGLTFTGGAHTTLANANAVDLNFNLSRTVQFGQNTTLALQTAALFDMTALSYSSSAATKTITKAIGVQIKGVPAAGTNAAITNPYAFAVTDNSDVIEVAIGQHNVNFGALIFGSVSRASAPSIGAASSPSTFSSGGNNMRFQSGAVNVSGRAGYTFASTSSIGFPSGTSTNSWIYSNPAVALSNSGATSTHNHLDLQPSTSSVTGATLFTLNTSNVAPLIDINAAVTAAVIRGYYYNPTQTTVGSNTTNKAWEHTSGYIQWNSVLSPSQITSNQNDYNPNGWTNGTTAPNGASILRLSTDASRNITSLAGGTTGRLVEIANVGSFNIVFTADDGSTGTAANRFVKTTTLYPGESVMAFYDGTSSRWMINGRMPQVPVDGIQSTYTNYTTTATYQNVASVTLPAGEWELSAFFTYYANSATITAASDAIFVISTTTASASGATEGKNIAYVPQAALLGTSHFSDAIAPYRVSPTTSTTYYLNTQATFTLGNPQFVGGLHANPVK